MVGMEYTSKPVFCAAALLTLALAFGPVSGVEVVPETEKLAPGLMEKAEAEGIVRVIVEVKASDPVAAGTAVKRGHCENTECAKISLQNSLREIEAPKVDLFDELPLILMEVTPEGLNSLEASTFVLRVTADEPVGVTPIDETPVVPIPGDNSDLSAPQSN